MATDLFVDSKAHCFFCLDKIATVKVEPASKPVQCPKYSAQSVSSYLKLDLEKLLNGMISSPSHLLLDVRKSRLTVELCDECACLNRRLSELCRQLEKLEMEVRSCLGLIHGKMSTAGIEKADKLGDLVVGDNDVITDWLELFEKTRAAAIKKCRATQGSQKLKADMPRVMIQKLTSAAINEPGSTHSAPVVKEDNLYADLQETGYLMGDTITENRITRSQCKGLELETRGGRNSNTKIPDGSLQKSMKNPKFKISIFRIKRHNEAMSNAFVYTKVKGEKSSDSKKREPERTEAIKKGSQKLTPDDVENPKSNRVRTRSQNKKPDTVGEENSVPKITDESLQKLKAQKKRNFRIPRSNPHDVAVSNDVDAKLKMGGQSKSKKNKEPERTTFPNLVRKIQCKSRRKVGAPVSVLNPETGKSKCGNCLMEFSSRWGFQMHYKSVHLKVRFKCVTCGKQFNHRTHCNRHQKSVHLKERIMCDTCGKQFTDRGNYNRHQKSVHGGIRYICQVCKTSFTFKTNVRQHQQTTGCGKKLGVEPVPKHICHLCGKAVSQTGNFNKHLKTVHNVE